MNKDKLDYLIKKLSKLSFVKAIWIFGSSVKKSRGYSDIDLAIVISPISENNKDEVLSHGSDVFDISIFSDLSTIMQFEVVNTGKLLYRSRMFKLKEFLFEVNRDYLDFKHVYDQSLKAYKEKIKNGKASASA